LQHSQMSMPMMCVKRSWLRVVFVFFSFVQTSASATHPVQFSVGEADSLLALTVGKDGAVELLQQEAQPQQERSFHERAGLSALASTDSLPALPAKALPAQVAASAAHRPEFGSLGPAFIGSLPGSVGNFSPSVQSEGTATAAAIGPTPRLQPQLQQQQSEPQPVTHHQQQESLLRSVFGTGSSLSALVEDDAGRGRSGAAAAPFTSSPAFSSTLHSSPSVDQFSIFASTAGGTQGVGGNLQPLSSSRLPSSRTATMQAGMLGDASAGLVELSAMNASTNSLSGLI
jgi:hypothetical protein